MKSLKVILFSLFIFLSYVYASEYNLDAIINAKGENKNQQNIDSQIAEDANKAQKSVDEKFYYKHTWQQKLEKKDWQKRELKLVFQTRIV